MKNSVFKLCGYKIAKAGKVSLLFCNGRDEFQEQKKIFVITNAQLFKYVCELLKKYI